MCKETIFISLNCQTVAVGKHSSQRTGIENVAGKDVPSADHLSLILVTKAKCKNRCPIVLRPPKQKLKESAESEFVPSAAIFAIPLLCVRTCPRRVKVYVLSNYELHNINSWLYSLQIILFLFCF